MYQWMRLQDSTRTKLRAFRTSKAVLRPSSELLRAREKAVAPHSSTLAWKIPWMEEPGRLQSMGSLRSDTTEQLHFHFSLFTFMHWGRKWQPTLVFLPGESQGRGSLLDCCLWDSTELDTTEVTYLTFVYSCRTHA